MTKKWNHVYEDDILITEVDDPVIGKTFKIKAKNGHLHRNRPHRFDTRIGKAYIYSDELLDGLTLVDSDTVVIANTIIKEDIEATVAVIP